MRMLGILLIVIAVGIGLILPWAQINLEGEEVATLEFPGFSRKGKGEGTVLLQTQDNPLRIRFSIRYLNDALLPPVKIPVFAKVSDRNGTLIGTVISFPTQGRSTGPEQDVIRAGSSLDLVIQNNGLHKLELERAPNNGDNGISNPAIESITARFIANASPVNDQYKIPALILGLTGFYLLVRSRRRKDGGDDSRGDPPKPKPRWGRGAA